MNKEKYTIQDVASRLNLSKNRVRKLIASGQLQPTNPGKRVVTISQSEFERYSQQRRAEKLERLKEIARACEELGLYDDDDDDEILELAKKQAQEFKAELIEKKLVASSGEICDALGFTRQSLSRAIRENRMFYLKQGHRHYYPVFYADNRLSRPVLEDVTRALGSLDGAQKWQFFTTPKGSLSGKTPLEALQEGLVDKVLIAAHGYTQR